MSLSAALARKKRRETHYDLLLEDPTAAEAAVVEAEAELRLAKNRGDSDAVGAAQAQLDEARTAVRECVHRIAFRPLPAAEFEALINEHPPTPEAQKKGEQWDQGTFVPALLAACAVDGDLDADGWAVELKHDRWNSAERQAIFNQALAVNLTSRSVTVPFD